MTIFWTNTKAVVDKSMEVLTDDSHVDGYDDNNEEMTNVSHNYGLGNKNNASILSINMSHVIITLTRTNLEMSAFCLRLWLILIMTVLERLIFILLFLLMVVCLK